MEIRPVVLILVGKDITPPARLSKFQAIRILAPDQVEAAIEEISTQLLVSARKAAK